MTVTRGQAWRGGRAGAVLAGRYRLLEMLGAGDMGVVWRATDQLLGRAVALKRVDTAGLDVAAAGQARRRLLREARIGAAVDHPRLLRVLDVLVDTDEPWLVLEHVDARSWATLQQRYGPMWPVGAARVAAQVAEGLAALHAAGIVHGDVTAENILVGRDASVRLADFGICRAIGDAAGPMAATTGGRDHRAPEVRAGAAPGPAADLYALGATVHEAVVGVPVREDAGASLLPLPAATGPLGGVLAALLSRDPVRRPDARGAWAAFAAIAG